MQIKTSRFGEVSVKDEDVIHFPQGILGFDSLKKFFIVDPNDKNLILWLQSVDNENIAFPILEPKIFEPTYQVEISPTETASLQLSNIENCEIYAIVTIPKNTAEISINMKAPIIINTQNRIARQIVLQNPKFQVKQEIYGQLKQMIMQKEYHEPASRKKTPRVNRPQA
ncbi:MAG: flagellar assembly protein FliW [Bacteriovoracaceae bacterium]|nr:flagellar assembly protein FliW [Bacteriovoracaceae bacterium]